MFLKWRSTCEFDSIPALSQPELDPVPKADIDDVQQQRLDRDAHNATATTSSTRLAVASTPSNCYHDISHPPYRSELYSLSRLPTVHASRAHP